MFLKRYLGIFAVYYIPINTVYTFGMNREFCLQRFSFVHNWMLDLKIQVHRYIRKLMESEMKTEYERLLGSNFLSLQSTLPLHCMLIFFIM